MLELWLHFEYLHANDIIFDSVFLFSEQEMMFDALHFYLMYPNQVFFVPVTIACFWFFSLFRFPLPFRVCTIPACWLPVLYAAISQRCPNQF